MGKLDRANTIQNLEYVYQKNETYESLITYVSYKVKLDVSYKEI